MCDSYHLTCHCGNKSADLFFGKMVLNQQAVLDLHCPECSSGNDPLQSDTVWDNDWMLTFDMAIVKSHAATFGVNAGEITAEWIFDQGYITWVGITPEDIASRNREREELQTLAKTDLRAYLAAMREWGIGREKRFSDQGWRKMRG